MRVAQYRNDKSLHDLVNRLYRLTENDPARADAEAALLAANPHLPLQTESLAQAIKLGTVIAVPEIEGRVDKRSSASLPAFAARSLHTQAVAVLDTIQRGVDADSAAQAARADETARLIASREFKAAARNPEIAKRLATAKARIEERRTRVQAVQAMRKQALDDARQRLDALVGVVEALVGTEGSGPQD
jgi:hypothetical protein